MAAYHKIANTGLLAVQPGWVEVRSKLYADMSREKLEQESQALNRLSFVSIDPTKSLDSLEASDLTPVAYDPATPLAVQLTKEERTSMVAIRW
jgi:hypothetical protein